MAQRDPFTDAPLKLLRVLYVFGGSAVLVGSAMLLLAAAAAGAPPNGAGGLATYLTAASLSAFAVPLLAGAWLTSGSG